MALIHEKMAYILSKADSITKDQTNKQQGFKYRGIDDIYNAMHKIFSEAEVFVAPEVMNKTREERVSKSGSVLIYTCLTMKYTFYATDGSSVSCVVEGEGMDSGDKSSNKAMAVAHKYAILQVFMIPTDEPKDPDAESHQLQMSPDPINYDKVEKAYAYLVSVIDNDELDDVAAAEQIQKGWKRLTNDEQIKVNEKLKNIKNGKKQYNTILREYLAYRLGGTE